MILLYRHYEVNRIDYTMGIKDLEYVATTNDMEKEINCISCEKKLNMVIATHHADTIVLQAHGGYGYALNVISKNGKSSAYMIKK